MRKGKEKISIWTMIFFISISVTVFTVLFFIMTWGRANIDSDTAFACRLARSLVDHKNIVSPSIMYVDGQLWCCLQNSFFSILPTIIIDNQPIARMVASSIMVIIEVVLIIIFSLKVFSDKSYRVIIPIILVGLGGWAGYYMLLVEADYTRPLIINLLLFVLYTVFLENISLAKRICVGGCIFSLCFFLGLDSIRSVAEVLLPFWLSGIVYMLYARFHFKIQDNERKGIRRYGIIFLAISFFAFIFGFFMNRWIVANYVMMVDTVDNAMVYASSLSELREELWKAIRSPFEIFGYQGGVEVASITGVWNLCSVLLSIAICFVTPILQIRDFNHESEVIKRFILFTFMQVLVVYSADIFLAKHGGYRLLSSICLVSIMSARYIYNKLSSVNYKPIVALALLMYIGMVVVDCARFFEISEGWREELQSKVELNNEILKHGVEKGYAQYWNAYSNELYSDFRINYNAVDLYQTYICPSAFCLNLDDYEAFSDRSFLLLSDEESEIVSPNMEAIYGAPVEVFECNGKIIYIFDYDISERFYPLQLGINDFG